MTRPCLDSAAREAWNACRCLFKANYLLQTVHPRATVRASLARLSLASIQLRIFRFWLSLTIWNFGCGCIMQLQDSAASCSDESLPRHVVSASWSSMTTERVAFATRFQSKTQPGAECLRRHPRAQPTFTSRFLFSPDHSTGQSHSPLSTSSRHHPPHHHRESPS